MCTVMCTMYVCLTKLFLINKVQIDTSQLQYLEKIGTGKIRLDVAISDFSTECV